MTEINLKINTSSSFKHAEGKIITRITYLSQ